MNIRLFTLLLIGFLCGMHTAFAQCQTGGASGGCRSKPVIKFRGAIAAEVGNSGSIEGTMDVGNVSIQSKSPPELGRRFVMMPEDAGNPDISSTARIAVEPEEVVSGSLNANIDWDEVTASSASWIAGFFDTENSCGLVFEISVKTDSNLTNWSPWEDKRSILEYVKPEESSRTVDFKVRFRKKDNSDSGGSQSDNGAGTSTGGRDAAQSYEPGIPAEQQDVPPTVPGGLPNQMSPAGFSSALALGASSGSEGFNTGTLWVSGPISPGLADVSKLNLSDPGENALTVILSGGNLRQVTNFQRLVDIQTAPGGGFDVKFYESGAFGTTPSGGLYPITGSPSVMVNYAPIAAVPSNHLGGVRVTTTGANQVAKQREILSTSGNGDSWREVIDGGAEVRDMTSVFLFESNHWKRMIQTSVTRAGTLVSKSEKTHLYQYRRAGTPAAMVENSLFLLESKTYDTTSTALTTRWEPVPNRIGMVKSVLRPDGSWEA